MGFVGAVGIRLTSSPRVKSRCQDSTRQAAHRGFPDASRRRERCRTWSDQRRANATWAVSSKRAAPVARDWLGAAELPPAHFQRAKAAAHFVGDVNPDNVSSLKRAFF